VRRGPLRTRSTRGRRARMARSAAAMWRPYHEPERSRTAAPRRRGTASAAAAVIGDGDDGGGRDRGMSEGRCWQGPPGRCCRLPAGID